MARCSRAWLPLLLLACALVQSSYGSRPPPREPQMAGVLSPTIVLGAGEPCCRNDGATKVPPSTEDGAAAAASSAIRGGGVASTEQRKGSGPPVIQQALGRMLGSRLARRVLGGEVEDSAAGPSCHSNNAHITCAPPAQH